MKEKETWGGRVGMDGRWETMMVTVNEYINGGK